MATFCFQCVPVRTGLNRTLESNAVQALLQVTL